MAKHFSKSWSMNDRSRVGQQGARVDCRWCCVLVASTLTMGVARADLQFVTVGAAGNRATLASETPWNPGLSRGSVGYEFRITQTEVLVHQWYDFVVAYRPFWTGAPNDSRLTSYIMRTADGQGYTYPAFMTNFPVFVTWEMAARY